jgi:hypothetical protein
MAAREKSRNPPRITDRTQVTVFQAVKCGAGGLHHVYASFYSWAMDNTLPPMPGQKLARGVARLLRSMDHAVLTEFVPARGLRVDVISLGPKGELWIVECKSCRADFASDRKWQGYLDWCDRYFWAVDCDFPSDLLPPDTGLILADSYGAEIARLAPETRLAAARRNRITRDFGRAAALRLQGVADPDSLSRAVF